MKRSRKQARSQTHRQTLGRKNALRLNLYHGTNAKSARSIRRSVLRGSHPAYGDNFTLANHQPIAKIYMRRVRGSKRKAKESSAIVKIGLTPHGVKKYLGQKETMPGELFAHNGKLTYWPKRSFYGVKQDIPSRYIAKRGRGK